MWPTRAKPCCCTRPPNWLGCPCRDWMGLLPQLGNSLRGHHRTSSSFRGEPYPWPSSRRAAFSPAGPDENRDVSIPSGRPCWGWVWHARGVVWWGMGWAFLPRAAPRLLHGLLLLARLDAAVQPSSSYGRPSFMASTRRCWCTPPSRRLARWQPLDPPRALSARGGTSRCRALS